MGETMNYLKKTFVISLILLTICSGSAVYAARSKNLPDNILIADEDGFTVQPNGVYFIDIPNLKPNEVYTKKLSVNNLYEFAFNLDMNVKKESMFHSGPQNLLEEITMSIKVDNRLLFEGPLTGIGTGFSGNTLNLTTQNLRLMNVRPEEQKPIYITLTASPEVKNFWELESVAKVAWEFRATQRPVDDTEDEDDDPLPVDPPLDDPIGEEIDGPIPLEPTPPLSEVTVEDDVPEPTPKTGVFMKYSLWYVVGGLLIMSLLLFIKKKQKDKDSIVIR
jgi:hypothetical protein